MSVAVRFAPSPTGRLHVGNARVALINWLFARKHAGRCLLRFDDTDPERSRPEFVEAIVEDLAWLGLDWDETVHQSARLARYEAASARLREAGRLYPCYETGEELEAKRRRQLRAGRPPVYDRAALRLSAGDRQRLEAEGRRPHWRFRLEEREVAWDDVVRGRCAFPPGSLSDPVLVRTDGRPLYTLSSAVDDLELGVSHVVRGEDHVANTAVQIQVFEALSGSAPAFAHLPLLTDIRGEGLSKRLGGPSVARLRAEGIEAMALNSYLAGLGSSENIVPRARLEDLVADFDLSKFGRAAPKFDPAELGRLNARLLHEMPFPAVAGRLKAMGLDGADAAFWEAVRPNLHRLEEARDWWRICHGPVAPVIEDPELTARAAELLPDGALDETSWGRWTRALREATGRSGAGLFRPLRLALTGCEHGPELKNLLPIIGRRRALARLRGETA